MDDLQRIYEKKQKKKAPKAFKDKVAALDKTDLGQTLLVLAEIFGTDEELVLRNEYNAWFDALREEDRIAKRIEEGTAHIDPNADPSK